MMSTRILTKAELTKAVIMARKIAAAGRARSERTGLESSTSLTR